MKNNQTVINDGKISDQLVSMVYRFSHWLAKQHNDRCDHDLDHSRLCRNEGMGDVVEVEAPL